MCRTVEFPQDPFCSCFNTFLFLLLVGFIITSSGFLLLHIHQDIRVARLRQQCDDEYRRLIQEDQPRHLEDPLLAGPSSRDLSGTDDSSSSPPNPARTGSCWNHFRRMMGSKITTQSTARFTSYSASPTSSSDSVYIGGEAGQQARSRHKNIKGANYGAAKDRIRLTRVDKSLGGDDHVIALGPTLQSAIAQRRRSLSTTGVFHIEMNK